MRRHALAVLVTLAAVPSLDVTAQRALPVRTGGKPSAIVDLRTEAGLALVRGEWRYRDADLIEVDSRGPGADLRASGAPVRTHDVEPKAGAAGYDDADWLRVPAEGFDGLEGRRGTGRTSFGWYRINVTVPERIGALHTRGTTLFFEVVVDDYAEVWVNGRLPRTLGQTGGSLAAGFNAPNRVLLTRNAVPGEQFQIAVFGINGPLSDPPPNFIWVRSATLEVFLPEPSGNVVPTSIVRHHPLLDRIISGEARIEKLADGFEFIEGPVWVPDGYLLFSDPNRNVIYRWSEEEGVSVYRVNSGYTGVDVGEYGQPGSNGLTLDPEGRLVIAEHGNRRITRLERNGLLTVLADRFNGRRLNSPNDLVYRADGVLYFTDPPFGLPMFDDDPRRELDAGVYAVAGAQVKLVSRDLRGPNGLAFSPDQQFLYVANWDPARKVVMRYESQPDGTLTHGRVFLDISTKGTNRSQEGHDAEDATEAAGDVAFDGLKVDERGNVYVSGPGGIWILAPDGTHLGTIAGPELPANFAWGDADGRTLYLTARTGLYRLRMNVAGLRPGPAAVAEVASTGERR